jgi:hypothetical protein
MQISETDLERDYVVFTEDELLRLGVSRRVFYVNSQLSADEITRRLAEFKAALRTS